nr:Glyco_hydro_1 [uncultured Clostridium sp.]
MIVENGLGAEDVLNEDGSVNDDYRIHYIQEHAKAMSDAINLDGVEVMGYTLWSAIDLISMSTGEMTKRYGLIYVDADDNGVGTYNRLRKDSFYWYKQLIISDGVILNSTK